MKSFAPCQRISNLKLKSYDKSYKKIQEKSLAADPLVRCLPLGGGGGGFFQKNKNFAAPFLYKRGGGLFAQSNQVSGTVTDQDGAGIPGVNIRIKGTAQGTSSNANGTYSLEAVDANAVLIFSSIGFLTQEISAEGRTLVDAVMQADMKSLDEVVVVGYGSQFQKEVTGAVQQIKAEELKDLPVAQITQKLQGRMAGVQINQITGKPGEGMQVRIRGQVSILAGSDPLYVVDGFPIVGGINSINPDEIENISVLKDAASTSFYGSPPANGVILITTKRGKSGKTTVDINSYYGIQQVPKKGRPDMMNGTEFAQFKKESYEDKGVAVPEPFRNPSQYGEGHDWYGAMLRSAPIQNYSVALSSNKERVRTTAVLGYFNQDGVLHNSNYARYSLRLNSEYKVSEKVRVGLNVAPSHWINNAPSSDGAFQRGGVLYNAALVWPILPYKKPDGSLPLTANIPGVSAFPTSNFYRALNEIKNETNATRLLSNAFVQVEPIKNLAFKSTINIDIGYEDLMNFKPGTAGTNYNSTVPGIASSLRKNNKYVSWLNENTVAYNKTYGDHSFEILAGFTVQKFRSDAQQITVTTFPDDKNTAIQSAINIDRTETSSDIQEWGLLSYLARLNYNYKGKYLLALAVRRDGSSRFGENNRWGNFPSVSAGWVISEEDFMPDLPSVSFIKFRGSYGIIGNNNIGNYTQYATVNPTTNAVFGSTIRSGASVTSMSNPNLGWETTKQLDIGLDVGLIQDRISVGYDYYLKHTDNLLYDVNVPQESGFNKFNGNIGEFKFWGHEFTLSSKNLTGNLKWSTDANISFNRNKVVKLSEGVNRLYAGWLGTITMVDQPIGQFWGLIHEGVYKDEADFRNSPKYITSETGTAKFRDVNGDGRITYGGDDDDRTIIGNPFPKFIYGITNTLSYKNFDISVVGAGSYGADILVCSDQGTTNLDGVFNVLKEVKNRWRSPENPGDGKYGKTTSATWMERDWEHTRFLSNGSYFTIKNVSLGYNLPTKIWGLRNLRVYGSIQQVYIFTNYRGMNPEVSTTAGGGTPTALELGMDWSTYPVPRTYTLGLNIGL